MPAKHICIRTHLPSIATLGALQWDARASGACWGTTVSSYTKELLQRFGDDRGPSDDGFAELPFVRQVLSRKTVRAYSDALPSDALLELLCAAALSASAKSDFQQASILRVRDAGKRAS